MSAWSILEADCVQAMAAMDECSVDAVVCDPPYGLEFMGKDWDKPWRVSEQRFADRPKGGTDPFAAARPRYNGDRARRVEDGRAMQDWHQAWAREALRVLKPGGHLIAFGGTRTYHRLVAGIEDAGFEIRDQLAWMYGSGFPKSLDVSKAIDKAAGAEREVVGPSARHVSGKPGQRTEGLNGSSTFAESVGMGAQITAPATPEAAEWDGWGTALKPAHEPIVLARKPLTGTVAANVLAHGTGAINVDGCRITTEQSDDYGRSAARADGIRAASAGVTFSLDESDAAYSSPLGRWPANVVLDPDAAAMLDEQTGARRASGVYDAQADKFGERSEPAALPGGRVREDTMYADSGGASRFFYCAKTSSAERNAGLDGFEEQWRGTMSGGTHERVDPRAGRDRTGTAARNVHPTVKPIDLMRWLVRLVTPPGGVVLDPFTGSGTTGCAAMLEGMAFVGIEREAEYAAIARARIAWWAEHPDGMSLVHRLEHEAEAKAKAISGQLNIFGEEAA